MILSSPWDAPRTSTKVEAADCRHHVISPQCHTSPFATYLFETTTSHRRVDDECCLAHDDGVVIVTEFMSSSRRIVRSKLFVLSLPSYCSFVILMMISIALLTQTPRADASLAIHNSPSSIINSLSTTTVTTGPTPITVLSSNTVPPIRSSASRKSKGNLLNYLKGQKPISIPENRVITSEDTEDYLEEDSAEFDYEELLKKENASGNFETFLLKVILSFVIRFQH